MLFHKITLNKPNDMEISICQRCKLEIDDTNRLNCGHLKCQRCDDSECTKCASNIVILEDISIKTDHLNISKKEASKKAPHISKEIIETGKARYFCEICNKHFLSRTQQYYHLFCNEQNKPYKCEKCPKSFSSLSHLKYHAEGHEETSLTCMTCSKSFKKSSTLRKHEKIHSEKKFFCEECGQNFREKATFMGHVARHQNNFLFSCELCEKKFSLKSSLNQHKASHLESKHKCMECGKLFCRSYSLKLHTLKHSKQEKHSCPICFKTFDNINSLTRHSNIHEEVKKYKCIPCDVSSVRKDNMIRHVRNMHAGEEFSNCIELIKESPAVCQSSTVDNSPKTVANSSVIKFIGNVQPMIIPVPMEEKAVDGNSSKDHTGFLKSKTKKKYDPLKIYRAILNEDDDPNSDEEDELKEAVSLTSDFNEKTVEQTSIPNHTESTNLLNFSERHWRKNLNLRVMGNWS